MLWILGWSSKPCRRPARPMDLVSKRLLIWVVSDVLPSRLVGRSATAVGVAKDGTSIAGQSYERRTLVLRHRWALSLAPRAGAAVLDYGGAAVKVVSSHSVISTLPVTTKSRRPGRHPEEGC